VSKPGKKAGRFSIGYRNWDKHPAWLSRNGRNTCLDSCLKKSGYKSGLSIHNEFSFESPLLDKAMLMTCCAFYPLKRLFTCSKRLFVQNSIGGGISNDAA